MISQCSFTSGKIQVHSFEFNKYIFYSKNFHVGRRLKLMLFFFVLKIHKNIFSF